MNKVLVQRVFAAALLALFLGQIALFVGRVQTREIRYIEFTAATDGAPAPWQVIGRGRVYPVALYTSDAPVIIPFEIPRLSRARDLWIQIGEADNHSRAIVRVGDQIVGEVDNRVNEALPEPRIVWKRVGEAPKGARDFSIELSVEEQRTFYAEIATLALTSRGASPNEFRAFAGASKNKAPDPAMAIIALLVAAATGAAMQRGWLRPAVRRPAHLLALFFGASAFCWTLAAANGAFAPERSVEQTAADGEAAERYGLERKYTDWADAAFDGATPVIRGIFDSATEYDSPEPQSQENAERILTSDFYRTDAPLNEEPKLSTRVLGGFLHFVQTAPQPAFNFMLGTSAALFIVGLAGAALTRSQWPVALGLYAIGQASVLCALHLSQAWDELYINLRHSYFLLDAGKFSINGAEFVEGTVDLAPLMATALLGRFGVDLTDALLIVTLSGNVLVAGAAYAMALALTKDRVWSLATAAAVALLPNVIWVGATGFTATLFTAWALWGAHFLLFTKRERLGLAFLATLTLVRVEGVLFAMLLGGIVYGLAPLLGTVRERNWGAYLRNGAIKFAILFAPFGVSAVIRALVYGAPIPNPVAYKNSRFDEDYVLNGLQQFRQMALTHDLHLIVALLVALFLCAAMLRARTPYGLIALPAALFVFISSYYIGGGDWFPVYWNRYAMPFFVGLVLAALILIRVVSGALFSKWRAALGAWMIALILFAPYHSSIASRPNNVWSYSYGLLGAQFGNLSDWWNRIDTLYVVGRFLRAVTPRDAVIASPEVATIMYFAEREMIDLLGVSNPKIANMPLQPLSAGDRLHRRRGHISVFEDRPDVIALWEPVMGVAQGDAPVSLEQMALYSKQHLFSQDKLNIGYFRVGSIEALNAMGYRHLFIGGADYVLSLFVHDRILPAVVEALSDRGYELAGTVETPYAVSRSVVERFPPAHPELIPALN